MLLQLAAHKVNTGLCLVSFLTTSSATWPESSPSPPLLLHVSAFPPVRTFCIGPTPKSSPCPHCEAHAPSQSTPSAHGPFPKLSLIPSQSWVMTLPPAQEPRFELCLFAVSEPGCRRS